MTLLFLSQTLAVHVNMCAMLLVRGNATLTALQTSNIADDTATTRIRMDDPHQSFRVSTFKIDIGSLTHTHLQTGRQVQSANLQTHLQICS